METSMRDRVLWTLFVAAVFVGLGNDFVFTEIMTPWRFYALDWAIKGSILASLIALGAFARPEGVPRAIDPGTTLAWIVGLGAAIFAMAVLRSWMPEAMRIFEWPRYGSTVLAVLDGTLGLALSAAAEEGVYRVLAMRLFGPTGWLVPTAAFAATHWGMGWPDIVVAFAAGALLWIAYRRTGSFLVVASGHYLGNLATYLLLR
jgi:membrane protease YdiL (CAAX protease family)